MLTEIKWQESIHHHRLVYTSAPFKNNSIGKILITVAFTLSLTLLIGGLWGEGAGGIVFILFVGVFFYILFSERSRHSLALTRVSGISPEENRKILHRILNELQWRIVEDNKHYLICSPSVSPFSAERQITILYDGNDILLNSLTFARAGNIAPFSTKGNASRMDKIALRFENLCTNKRTHGKRRA